MKLLSDHLTPLCGFQSWHLYFGKYYKILIIGTSESEV